jgi:UDPglucose 6-dehydrogenase
VKIGIVGYGVVGKALARLFGYGRHNPDLEVHDKYLEGMNSEGHRAAIQKCDIVFVAVPTPEAADGSCDLSAVEEVIDWASPPICVKSTVPPGTTDRLAKSTGKKICFSPEYIGETAWHVWKGVEDCGFIIVGGEKPVCSLVVRAYQRYLGPLPCYHITDAKTAELCKYMSNTFLATKVAFVNQFYDLAQGFGVDFDKLRELWLADPRIGRSHTMVTEERGYRGRCLPKEMAALIKAAHSFGGAPLLEAVDRYNDALCHRSDESRSKRDHRGRSTRRKEEPFIRLAGAP